MGKSKFFWFSIVFCFLPAVCQAGNLDTLKADFLQCNYRRVILQGQAQAHKMIGGSDELNYILGLSYLKEGKLTLAQYSFKQILNDSKSKFKDRATLGLGDTYLMGGNFQEANDIYNKLISDNSNSKLKGTVLFRLSQLELKRGNNQKSNEYLVKLRRDFPLNLELKSGRSLALIEATVNEGSEFCVQVGYFANSNNANNLKDKLLLSGYPAYVDNFNTGYRVKVGKFKTQKQAQEFENKLSQDGFQTKLCP